MSTNTAVHCIVDDTALTTNISELEAWVAQGVVTLVVPLHTLERLHLLKKDSSQIGHNARKAVKFLDRMTSGTEEVVTIQGPDEQYATWEEVEAHYTEEPAKKDEEDKTETTEKVKDKDKDKDDSDKSTKRSSTSGNALSQILLDKLNFATQPPVTSPASTPPMSPSSSEPQSSKTSPEVKAATIAVADKSPAPPTLKPLLNPVVWYIHEKQAAHADVFFLTNSADTQHLARDFKVPTKTIHQLRSAIGKDVPLQQEISRKHRSTPSLTGEDAGGEPKTLFSYEDDSEDEEVVFKPKGRGASVARGPVTAVRSGPHGSLRSKGNHNHARSPRLSFSTPTQSHAASNRPQIPIEEIDPDSFDRGSFGRGSVPLANTGSNGNHVHNHFNSIPRGPSRGGFPPVGPSRGSNFHRGRGSERGSARGRGRLFVP